MDDKAKKNKFPLSPRDVWPQKELRLRTINDSNILMMLGNG